MDDVAAAFAELKANGLQAGEPDCRTQQYGDASCRVFFVTTPDGPCPCPGERQG